MPSLLFGPSPSPQRVERGEFFCPSCRETRHYERIVVRRSLGVFSKAILPLGRYGEYIECAHCLATFRPEVLAYDAGDETAEVMAEYQRVMKRVLALMVVTDGEILDSEIEMVREVFEAVSGARLSRGDVLGEARAVTDSPNSVARYLAQVLGYLNVYGKEQILRAAAMVSRADGRFVASEIDMVRRLGAVMRLPAERIRRVIAQEPGTPPPGIAPAS